MSDQSYSTPVTRGTEQQIMSLLWKLCLDGLDPIQVATAVRQVQGYRLIQRGGEHYEVEDPAWTLEQDVYGCQQCRACTSVTPAQRVRFEAMIAACLEAEG